MNWLVEVRTAARALRSRPGFATAAVLTLALGIGANIAILGVVDAVLLHPLTFDRAEELVLLRGGSSRSQMSLANLRDLRAGAQSLAGLSGFVAQSVNWTGTERPDRLRGGFVSGDFFSLLGVNAELGRGFVAADEVPGAPRIAVLDHAVWRSRFGGDPSVVGRSVTLNGEPHTIVGVAPASMRFPIDAVEIWIPDIHHPSAELMRRDNPIFEGVGRLRDGWSLEAARVELATLAGRLATAYPDSNAGFAVQLEGLAAVVLAPVRPGLALLAAGVGVILIVAAVNFAYLLFARSTQRLAAARVRVAVGSSKGRLLFHLLTEPLLLGLAGGAVGFAAGAALARTLLAIGSDYLPPVPLGPENGRLALVALVVSLLVGGVCGLLPALAVARRSAGAGFASRGAVAPGERRSVTSTVAAGSQLALSVFLIVGSGLLVRSFQILAGSGPGFDAAGLMSLEYRLPRGRYAQPEAQWEFHRRVLAEVERVPGVSAAAVVSGLPLSGNGSTVTYGLPGAPPPLEGRAPRAVALSISPRYFETLGLPLVAGRALAASDGPSSPLVVVVNQVLAASLWPNEDPVGQRLALLSEGVEAEVVGVAPAARQFDLAEEPLPQVYVAYAQNPGIFATLVARAQGEPERLGEALRAAVWTVDPDQPVWKVRPVEILVANRLAPRRLLALLTAAVAAIALALTMVGLYGLLAYRVALRRREFGLRLALGAAPAGLSRRLFASTLRLAAAGVVAGALLAWAATRWIRSLLWQVQPLDPATYAAGALLVVAVAVLATLGPARRAARVDPAEALRGQ